MDKMSFQALTAPTRVAVVGAAPAEESWYGGRVYEKLQRNSVGRIVYPVNSRRAGQQLLGQRVLASVGEVPEPPDLTVIATPWSTVPALLTQAARAGTRAAIVLASYKGEDPDGMRRFDEELRQIATDHDIAMLGPNSMGLMNGNAQLVATFGSGADHGVPPGGLAFISQSGAAISFMLQLFGARGIGYSHLISTGNEAALSLPDVLEHVVDDPATSSIVLFVEGVADGVRLRRALAQARVLGKPVALFKVGRSTVGQSAAQSHTGRVVGNAAALDAVLSECGVQVAHSFQTLFDYAAHFARRAGGTKPAGRRAAVVGTSGGIGIAASDDLIEAGWTLPDLPGRVIDALRTVTGAENLPHHLANPIDVTGTFGDTSRLAIKLPEITRILADCDEYDEVFVLSGAGGPHAQHVAASLADDLARGTRVGVTVGWVGIPDAARGCLEQSGVSVFDDPSRAIRAATALASAEAASEHRAGLKTIAHAAPEPERASTGRPGSPDRGSTTLRAPRLWTASEVRSSIARSGATVARSQLVDADIADARLAALGQSLGYPLVAKIESHEVSHKTDVGGVVLGIDSPDALIAARARLRDVLASHGGNGQILVQQSVAGIEVLVGARWDDSFGHLLVVGLGGTLAELFADFRSTLLPTYPGRIAELVRSHDRLRTLLDGYRGQPRASLNGLVELVERTADWLGQQGPAVRELDLNPVIVTSESAVIVDARAVGV